MINSRKFFGACVATAMTIILNVLPSLATSTGSTYTTVTGPVGGNVDIGQCSGATALILPLPEDDAGKGFGGGNTAALLVNSGVGESGVAFIPNYGDLPTYDRKFTNGAITFKDDGVTRKNAMLNFCIGDSGKFFASKPLTAFSIVSLGGGWSQVQFNTREIGTSQSILNKLTLTLSTRGNIVVGNTYWNLYGSPGTQVIPATVDSTVQGCNILNSCTTAD